MMLLFTAVYSCYFLPFFFLGIAPPAAGFGAASIAAPTTAFIWSTFNEKNEYLFFLHIVSNISTNKYLTFRVSSAFQLRKLFGDVQHERIPCTQLDSFIGSYEDFLAN
jgi:hypothetical protein